jgi:hypothetical protein
LEIILTIFVFLSSFLVLSIEKYWWGGYLTASPESKTFFGVGHAHQLSSN